MSETNDLPFDPPAAPAPVPPKIPNLKDLVFELRDTLAGELQGLLGDADASLRSFAAEIAPALVSAAATGDSKLQGELEAQVKALAELHKIKAASAAWRTVRAVSAVALRALSIGLNALSGGIAGGIITSVTPVPPGPIGRSVVGRVSRPL